MINLVRLGDTTDHDGEVITASDTMRQGGRRVARKGDHVTCPLHPDINRCTRMPAISQQKTGVLLIRERLNTKWWDVRFLATAVHAA